MLRRVVMDVMHHAYTETARPLTSIVRRCKFGGFADLITDDEGILISESILVEGFLAQK